MQHVIVLTSERIKESQRSLSAELILVRALDEIGGGEGAAAAGASLGRRSKGCRRAGKKRADGKLVHVSKCIESGSGRTMLNE